LKKIFPLQQANKHTDRVVESIKNEIRKYMKRERNKKLPEDALYWDFDCRFGHNDSDASSVSASAIITGIDKAKDDNWKECYIEIIAKASFKTAK
jgi:acetoin utilization deacetylase AcuC-like enzyme